MQPPAAFTPKTTVTAISVAACVVGLIAVALVAITQTCPCGKCGNELPDRFDYNINKLREVDPALVKYAQAATIPLEMSRPRAIAVGPDDKIYVGGDRQIDVFAPDGGKLQTFKLAFEPRSLAVAGERIYAAEKSRVTVLDNTGETLTSWPDRGAKAVFTSVALEPVEGNDIYAADAGGRVVLRYDKEGNLLGEIGRPAHGSEDADDGKGEVLGFIIPSPYFDVAVGGDGLLRVVNPGLHRIQAFTPEGLLEKPLTWGATGYDIATFCGCCNPAAMTMLPDGRFVTGEKGLPRVKIYSPEGRFECVVAGPKTLDPTQTTAEDARETHRLEPVDLAADSRGRILVLDPSVKLVRIFTRKLFATDEH